MKGFRGRSVEQCTVRPQKQLLELDYDMLYKVFATPHEVQFSQSILLQNKMSEDFVQRTSPGSDPKEVHSELQRGHIQSCRSKLTIGMDTAGRLQEGLTARQLMPPPSRPSRLFDLSDCTVIPGQGAGNMPSNPAREAAYTRRLMIGSVSVYRKFQIVRKQCGKNLISC